MENSQKIERCEARKQPQNEEGGKYYQQSI